MVKTLNIDKIAEKMFGKATSTCIEEKICVCCNNSIKEIRDELSVKEYGISGMCQQGQDEVFGEW